MYSEKGQVPTRPSPRILQGLQVASKIPSPDKWMTLALLADEIVCLSLD